MACAGAHRSALVAARLALTDVPRRRGASATGSRPRRRDAHRGWMTPTRHRSSHQTGPHTTASARWTRFLKDLRTNALADATPPASSTPSGDPEEVRGRSASLGVFASWREPESFSFRLSNRSFSFRHCSVGIYLRTDFGNIHRTTRKRLNSIPGAHQFRSVSHWYQSGC